MTYRDFITALHDIADRLEENVKGSQVITLRDHISGDADTFLFDFEDQVANLYDNILGEYGHVVNIEVKR